MAHGIGSSAFELAGVAQKEKKDVELLLAGKVHSFVVDCKSSFLEPLPCPKFLFSSIELVSSSQILSYAC